MIAKFYSVFKSDKMVPLNESQGGKHMKFSEYPYHTIDVKQAKDTLVKIEKRLMNAEDYASFKQAFKDLDAYKKELYTCLLYTSRCV